jgi:hypothetical protein
MSAMNGTPTTVRQIAPSLFFTANDRYAMFIFLDDVVVDPELPEWLLPQAASARQPAVATTASNFFHMCLNANFVEPDRTARILCADSLDGVSDGR